MQKINQRKVVREQYKTPDNLNARISIHAKYSTNKLGFGNWLFSNYAFSPADRILELGCGTGDFWKSKLRLLDKSIELTLTDFSEKMVDAAQAALEKRENLFYRIVDIENIPWADYYFDKIIANMMLYHVPDLDKGLSEVKRVLTDNGEFYCATYGEHGIMSLLSTLLNEYGIEDTTNKTFTLQNGYGILSKYFSRVVRLDYKDSLEITNLDDMLDYIYSLTNMSSIAKLERLTLKKVLEKQTVNGVLSIPKEYGAFVCRK